VRSSCDRLARDPQFERSLTTSSAIESAQVSPATRCRRDGRCALIGQQQFVFFDRRRGRQYTYLPCAYLDNNIVSAIAKDDEPTESDALDRLLEANDEGKVHLVTSKLTLMEIKALARGREVSFYRAARRVLCSASWRPRLKLTISAESRVGGTAHAHDFLSSKSMPVHKRLLDSCWTPTGGHIIIL
jgi:hypothetical protein